MQHDAPDASGSGVGFRRALNLPLLTLYGLGVTVGAGIYVLIGATAGAAGPFAWMAFMLAAVVAGFTAFSYAELSTRYPVSSGESAFVLAGFGHTPAATLVGLLVAASGLISASAITVGASGYLADLTGVPGIYLIIGIVVAMWALAWWGIVESVAVAGTITVIEILGLVVVIGWGLAASDHAGTPLPEMLGGLDPTHLSGIAAATVLAFFAFIGFEDMVNVAEEVENPRRTIPGAIILTLIVATILYVAVCVAVLLAVPVDQLRMSDAPLTLVFADAPVALRTGFAAIAGLATVNGVLIQMIMVSRVLFGMADRGQLPRHLARVSTRTRTPFAATTLVAAIILGLALLLPIAVLAQWTSQIVLTVFVSVNLSLIAIKRRRLPAADHFNVPMIVPLLGLATSLGLLVASVL